jgi:hypothetical protein
MDGGTTHLLDFEAVAAQDVHVVEGHQHGREEPSVPRRQKVRLAGTKGDGRGEV